MNKTASMVLKIIGASLAFAAVICGMKKRLARKCGSEYDDYADEELYE